MPDVSLIQFSNDPSCEACDLFTEAHHVCVPTIWMPDSLPPTPQTRALFVIGQNPGYWEDERGEPFIGDSGKMLRGAYLDADFNICAQRPAGQAALRHRRTIYLSNAGRCGPESCDRDKVYNTCLPLYLIPDLIQVCKFHTDVTILVISAKAVTALFKWAGIKGVNQRDSFNNQGRKISIPLIHNPNVEVECKDSQKVEVPVYSSYHPAAVARYPNYGLAVNDHLQLLCNHLDGLTPKLHLPTITPIRRPNQ